jgi:hypothetical protein
VFEFVVVWIEQYCPYGPPTVVPLRDDSNCAVGMLRAVDARRRCPEQNFRQPMLRISTEILYIVGYTWDGTTPYSQCCESVPKYCTITIAGKGDGGGGDGAGAMTVAAAMAML